MDVLYFLGKKNSGAPVVFLGLCPSSRKRPFKNGTFDRLQRWCQEIGLKDWDFYNVIPNRINALVPTKKELQRLEEITRKYFMIVVLGESVSRVCTRLKIPHYRIDHPSPRNRNLNSREYERRMLSKLRDYLWS